MKKLMIYGATGYTGRMVAEHAEKAGTPVVLGGRSEGPLAELAAKLGVDYRVFALDDDAEIDRALTDVAVLVNAAGPFMRTAKPLMEASIRNRVHYIDSAAELDSYRLAEQLDVEAKAAGVTLLPGGGGSVAMLGSLAGHAIARVKNPGVVWHLTVRMRPFRLVMAPNLRLVGVSFRAKRLSARR
ncbi:saccharopine dehydrogenase NADP-binding domain-containing protein (plasmid) [Agrobacterium rosae]|uniref:saccharopine dehydrogenase NADP-binding domain-containing protein n=1 Tax=Agrobacterium rosae TaxID=1972867 RepID=UPI002A1058B1|nr:saccharopine dehydrogenase NADP-binding domain-containing protein [Agrobacterium rosae]MDX8316117.1 saccharopine dehydrogenase NADP-binding domain-containing protein [Agrobacterium rosae]